MPPELWSILTNAGPVAGIMGFMWWLERKQRVEYQKKYEQFLQEQPSKLLKHAEDRRAADAALIENFKKLTRAVWANLKGRGNSAEPYRSLPPPTGEDDV